MMGTYGGVLGFIFFLLLVVGFVLLVWWVVKQVSQPTSEGPSSSKSIEILKERYAKGEITKEEFEKIRKDLSG